MKRNWSAREYTLEEEEEEEEEEVEEEEGEGGKEGERGRGLRAGDEHSHKRRSVAQEDEDEDVDEEDVEEEDTEQWTAQFARALSAFPRAADRSAVTASGKGSSSKAPSSRRPTLSPRSATSLASLRAGRAGNNINNGGGNSSSSSASRNAGSSASASASASVSASRGGASGVGSNSSADNSRGVSFSSTSVRSKSNSTRTERTTATAAANTLLTLGAAAAQPVACIGVTRDVDYFAGVSLAAVAKEFNLVNSVWKSIGCTGTGVDGKRRCHSCLPKYHNCARLRSQLLAQAAVESSVGTAEKAVAIVKQWSDVMYMGSLVRGIATVVEDSVRDNYLRKVVSVVRNDLPLFNLLNPVSLHTPSHSAVMLCHDGDFQCPEEMLEDMPTHEPAPASGVSASAEIFPAVSNPPEGGTSTATTVESLLSSWLSTFYTHQSSLLACVQRNSQFLHYVRLARESPRATWFEAFLHVAANPVLCSQVEEVLWQLVLSMLAQLAVCISTRKPGAQSQLIEQLERSKESRDSHNRITTLLSCPAGTCALHSSTLQSVLYSIIAENVRMVLDKHCAGNNSTAADISSDSTTSEFVRFVGFAVFDSKRALYESKKVTAEVRAARLPLLEALRGSQAQLATATTVPAFIQTLNRGNYSFPRAELFDWGVLLLNMIRKGVSLHSLCTSSMRDTLRRILADADLHEKFESACLFVQFSVPSEVLRAVEVTLISKVFHAKCAATLKKAGDLFTEKTSSNLRTQLKGAASKK